MLGRMAVPASLRSRVPRPGLPRPAAGPDRPAPAPAATLADPATLPPLDPQRRHWPGREMTSGGVTLRAGAEAALDAAAAAVAGRPADAARLASLRARFDRGECPARDMLARYEAGDPVAGLHRP